MGNITFTISDNCQTHNSTPGTVGGMVEFENINLINNGSFQKKSNNVYIIPNSINPTPLTFSYTCVTNDSDVPVTLKYTNFQNNTTEYEKSYNCSCVLSEMYFRSGSPTTIVFNSNERGPKVSTGWMSYTYSPDNIGCVSSYYLSIGWFNGMNDGFVFQVSDVNNKILCNPVGAKNKYISNYNTVHNILISNSYSYDCNATLVISGKNDEIGKIYVSKQGSIDYIFEVKPTLINISSNLNKIYVGEYPTVTVVSYTLKNNKKYINDVNFSLTGEGVTIFKISEGSDEYTTIITLRPTLYTVGLGETKVATLLIKDNHNHESIVTIRHNVIP